jgi:hypothetical protein
VSGEDTIIGGLVEGSLGRLLEADTVDLAYLQYYSQECQESVPQQQPQNLCLLSAVVLRPVPSCAQKKNGFQFL